MLELVHDTNPMIARQASIALGIVAELEMKRMKRVTLSVHGGQREFFRLVLKMFVRPAACLARFDKRALRRIIRGKMRPRQWDEALQVDGRD